MKLRNKTLGLVSLVLISACGKNIQGPTAEQGKGTHIGAIITAKVKNSANLEIKPEILTGLSDLDITQVAEGLPFTNDKETGIRNLGNPTFAIKGENGVGFVKATNLVFRSVLMLPPKAAINAVEKMELHLKGVRRYSPEALSEASLSEQVLCSIDAKVCSGVAPHSQNKSRNQKFEARYESKAFSEKPLKFTHTLKDKEGFLYSYSTQVDEEESTVLVIDLQKAFGLGTDLDANLEFLDKAGVALSKDSAYRKYRFVIGNNTYFDEGALVVKYDLDQSKIPAGYVNQKPAPAEGDLKITTFDKKEIEADVEAMSSEEGSNDGSVDDALPAANEPAVNETEPTDTQNQQDSEESQDLFSLPAASLSYDVSLEKLGITSSSPVVSSDGYDLLEGMNAILGKYSKAVSHINWVLSYATLKLSSEAQEALEDTIEKALKANGITGAVNGSLGKETKPLVKISIVYTKDASAQDKQSLEYALDGLLQIEN